MKQSYNKLDTIQEQILEEEDSRQDLTIYPRSFRESTTTMKENELPTKKEDPEDSGISLAYIISGISIAAAAVYFGLKAAKKMW